MYVVQKGKKQTNNKKTVIKNYSFVLLKLSNVLGFQKENKECKYC